MRMKERFSRHRGGGDWQDGEQATVTGHHPSELPRVSIVVPTRNSARTLDACLASILQQSYRNLETIVVDNSSSDATRQIASEHGSLLLTAGPERSTQRNHGARAATGSFLLFVDSDMALQPTVVEDCVAAARSGAEAVIVPEASFGEGFWARCKRLERSCYVGDDEIEAARFFTRDLFFRLGEFDEELRGPEDWDLSRRAASSGASIARVSSMIRHDEGRLQLRPLLSKKFGYGKSVPSYRRKHAATRQFRLVRPAFVRHRRSLAAEPVTAAGMLLMKTLEFSAGALGALSTLAQEPHGDRVIASLVGNRGRVRSIAFREAGRAFRADVNEDTLWGAVKDNLVLAEYERAGIRLASANGVVVDAGAHVGLFSLLASAHARTVIALEAHPTNFALLAANVAGNRAENVEARHRALWSAQESVYLVEGPQSSAGSVLGGNGRTFAVQADTLDSIVAETGPVDLLKLDIEGAEFAVLEHASDETLGQISAVVAELHLEGRRERLAPTVDRLRASGFGVVVSEPPSAHWRAAMRAVLRNRRRLRGEARLRLTVVALYSLVAALRPVAGRAVPDDELLFLYATRDGAR
jgi:FkbM family methyltransferase